MNKLVLANTALAIMIAAPAMAADMPVKAPPLPAPSYNWVGFYVGVNAGYAWGSSRFTTDPNCPPTPAAATFCNAPPDPSAPNGSTVAAAGSGRLKSNGFSGGVQAGYNWQTGIVVSGVEAVFNALHLKKTVATAGTFPVGFLGTQFALTDSSEAQWLATVRARLGVIVAPNVLLYATGGWALAKVESASSYSDNAIAVGFPGGAGSGGTSAVRTGWAAGGGVEWLLAANWTLKAEYVYVGFRSRSFTVPTANTAAFTQTMVVAADLATNIARLGINYRF